MLRCFENGNGDFGPEAFRAIHCAQLSTNGQAVSWFKNVSYSRVLGQRPTFYCPLFCLRKTGNSPQAINADVSVQYRTRNIVYSEVL